MNKRKKLFHHFDIVHHINKSSRYVVTGFIGHGTGMVVCKNVYTGSIVSYHYSFLRKVA